MIRAYQKYIAEGKLPIYFAILASIGLRILFYLYTDNEVSVCDFGDGFLWVLISSFFENNLLISYLSSFVFAVGISLLASFLNKKYTLIRKRSHLLFAITLLLLSSVPQFAIMNPQLIGGLFFLLAIDKVYASYQSQTSPRMAFDFGFYFAIASLFTPDILLFLPLFWVGLSVMRSFNIKAILSSLLGLVLIYWIVLFYFLSIDNLEGFYRPFLISVVWEHIPIMGYSFIEWGTLIFSTILMSIVVFNYYCDNYKDKMRVRANITFVVIVLLYSLLIYFLVPLTSDTCLLISLVSGSLVVAHFFALANKRWQVYLFYIVTSFYIAYCLFLYSI